MSFIRVPFADLKEQYHAISGEIDDAVRGVIQRADFILGKEVEEFETEFAAYLGVKHAVGVGSGLAALELALRAYGIGPGDEVVTAANSFVATALAIAAVGARPVLADIDPLTHNIDPRALEAAITPRARAAIPVHLYGQPAALEPILAVSERHNLLVIEDACQAHGARYQGRRVGGFGHAAAFSFYPAKNLGAYGDGGMVTTDDPSVAEKVRRLRNYGQVAKYHHEVAGTNSRLDTLQAAVLRVKLRYLDRWNESRRQHASSYGRLLDGLPLRRPSVAGDVEHVYHLYVIEVDERDRVREALHALGVETGIHYPVPIHLQKAFASLGHRPGDFPVTEAAAQSVLSLPMFPELTEAQVADVAEALSRTLTVSSGASRL